MFFKVTGLISLICLVLRNIRCTCGPPGIPSGADVYGHSATASEGQVITYVCSSQYKQVYGRQRRCFRDRWTPRLPKCAQNVSHILKPTNYKVIYLDRSESTGSLMADKTFETLTEIGLNSSKKLIFQIDYKPNARISVVELNMHCTTHSLKSFTSVNLFINKYRKCTSSLRGSTEEHQFYVQFICEVNSKADYESETNDLPNSFRLSLESDQNFKLNLKSIGVYRFQDNCGQPDIPLNAKSINSGNNVIIYPSKPERYKLLEANNDTIKCQYEGNWDKQFPTMYPITQCPVYEFNWNSSRYKNVEFEYFEYFGNDLLAATDSKVEFQCRGNDTEVHNIFCKEDGSWTGDVDACLPFKITKGSSLRIIVITLLSTFVSTLALIFVLGSVIVWRRRRRKQKATKKSYSIKTVEEFETYEHFDGQDIPNHYYTINYEYVDFGDNTNNSYREAKDVNVEHIYTTIV